MKSAWDHLDRGREYRRPNAVRSHSRPRSRLSYTDQLCTVSKTFMIWPNKSCSRFVLPDILLANRYENFLATSVLSKNCSLSLLLSRHVFWLFNLVFFFRRKNNSVILNILLFAKYNS